MSEYASSRLRVVDESVVPTPLGLGGPIPCVTGGTLQTCVTHRFTTHRLRHTDCRKHISVTRELCTQNSLESRRQRLFVRSSTDMRYYICSAHTTTEHCYVSKHRNDDTVVFQRPYRSTTEHCYVSKHSNDDTVVFQRPYIDHCNNRMCSQIPQTDGLSKLCI